MAQKVLKIQDKASVLYYETTVALYHIRIYMLYTFILCFIQDKAILYATLYTLTAIDMLKYMDRVSANSQH